MSLNFVLDTNVLLASGIYSVPEASALTGISTDRLRRWLRGYEFKLRGEKRPSRHVFKGDLPILDDTLALSFLDLQEARCIAEFRRRHVGWRALREAHLVGQTELGTRHPFATGQFKTLGRRLMLDAASKQKDGVLLDLAKSQHSFRVVLAPYLRGLQFLNDRPVRWFPLAGSERVVLHPEREFGRPIVRKRGVATSILMRSYKVEKSYEKVARWYEVDLRSVKDAVRFELAIAA
jgi:uncharacterized protein (DUF433 family)